MMQLYNASHLQVKRNLKNLSVYSLKTGMYDPLWRQYTILSKREREEQF